MINKIKYIFLCLLISFSFSSSAAEYFRLSTSFRYLTMGGAGVSNAADIDSLFYNPATLANIRTFLLDLAAGQVEYSTDGLKYYNSIQKLRVETTQNNEVTVFDDDTRDDYYDFINSNQSELDIFIRGRASTGFAYNFLPEGLTIGAVGSNETLISSAIEISGINDSSIDYKISNYIRNDVTAIGGISIPLFARGSVVLGLSIKSVSRYLYDADFNLGYVLQGIENIQDATYDIEYTERYNNTNSANSYDAGLMFRIPGVRLRFAFVAQNIGDLKFKDIPVEKMQFNAGFSFVPSLFRQYQGGIRVTFAADYLDITDANTTEDDNETLKKVNAGVEIGFFPRSYTTPLLALRAGYHQGYPTYGVETNFGTGRTIILGAGSTPKKLETTIKQKNLNERFFIYLSDID